jgi:tRNA-splicing ligase RtcB (3'-phosphate/5'-hydroxy nucleic acid ligase)
LKEKQVKVVYNKNEQKIPIRIWGEDLEESAMQQALAMSNHPCSFGLSLMPDAHSGQGVPIGSVWALQDAICCNAVGSDIGCGMCAYNTGLTVEQVFPLLKNLRESIIARIPVGFSHRPTDWATKNYPSTLSSLLESHITVFRKLRDQNIQIDEKTVAAQLATLGGGNHFLEIQKDQDGKIWVMIHSGSRNIGKQVADHYNGKALYLNRKWHSAIPNKDLAFFPLWDEEGHEYESAMKFALDFAFQNRKVMMQLIEKCFNDFDLSWSNGWEKEMINIHHNYAVLEHHFDRDVVIHRKGATLARASTTGIIPGSMGTNSYIVQGKNSKESFTSCSHGAGRRMSRSQAKKQISMDAFKSKMQGIEYEPVAENLDEAPQAYKDINEVMKQQEDLVDIVTTLYPLAVIKG